MTLEIARRLYRWRHSNIGIKKRLKRLRKELDDVPRTDVGVRLKDLDPSLDKRVAPMRQKDRELIIGDFDQDGGILPRFGEIAGAPTIAPTQFLARSGSKVSLVDLNGRLGVRKDFASEIGRFVLELEALLCLERGNCPVPRVMNVDWETHSITLTFVPGHVVRELLAAAGANIRDRDLREPFSRSRLRERVRVGLQFVPKIMSDKQIAGIAAGLNAIHSAGFSLEDVKFGNIILEANSGEPVFIDLERALPIDGLPHKLADHLKE
ncbi:MAG TPA: hypothetical protein VE820_14900, partial [Sphingomicrobium sp.]|nr:hypothetical protein [Sphingomicrobium sp.]